MSVGKHAFVCNERRVNVEDSMGHFACQFWDFGSRSPQYLLRELWVQHDRSLAEDCTQHLIFGALSDNSRGRIS